VVFLWWVKVERKTNSGNWAFNRETGKFYNFRGIRQAGTDLLGEATSF
jgi:hypothetical protein